MPVCVREGADGAVAVLEVVVLFARAREADDLRTTGVVRDENAVIVVGVDGVVFEDELV